MKPINLNQKICCDDILQFIFDLTKQDILVYKKLKQTGESRADILAEKIKKERSTVYRSLQKLTCAGITSKETKKIPSGGYYHIYKIKENNQIKNNLEKCIEKWYNQMKQTIKQLD